MIDIIIPAFNAHDTIKSTLDSIAYQTCINIINVYVVDDNSDTTYDEIIKPYSNYMNINIIRLDKNEGPGVAREKGLKISNSEYVLFIDADDTFASPNSVETLYNSIINNKCDVVVGTFLEINNNNYYEHKDDFIWLHGKIYKREFLKNNNIHFNDSRYNEDNYFNICVYLSEANIQYINDIVYYWNYNPNSITRKNNYEYNSYQVLHLIKNTTEGLEFGIKNDKNKQLIATKCYMTLISIYYYYEHDKNDDYIKESIRLNSIYDEYKEYINNPDNLYDIQKEYSLRTIFNDKPFEEDISFIDFINKIKDSK